MKSVCFRCALCTPVERWQQLENMKMEREKKLEKLEIENRTFCVLKLYIKRENSNLCCLSLDLVIFFPCFSFLFAAQCSQFVVAYFRVGCWHFRAYLLFEFNQANCVCQCLNVCVCLLVRFNYFGIVVSVNVFVCRTWLVEHFEWQIPIQQAINCAFFHHLEVQRWGVPLDRHHAKLNKSVKSTMNKRNNNTIWRARDNWDHTSISWSSITWSHYKSIWTISKSIEKTHSPTTNWKPKHKNAHSHTHKRLNGIHNWFGNQQMTKIGEKLDSLISHFFPFFFCFLKIFFSCLITIYLIFFFSHQRQPECFVAISVEFKLYSGNMFQQ